MLIQEILNAIGLSLNEGNRDRLKPRRDSGAIAVFQQNLADKLGGSTGSTEVYLFSNAGDRADILIQKIEGYTVIIEIDATRADQVAKKMMSRFFWAMPNRQGSPIDNAVTPGNRVVYVSLLYPGTEKMNPEECKKYFVMGAEVLTKLNSDAIFIGYIISDSLENDYCYCSGSSVCGCSHTVSCSRSSMNGAAQIPPQQACNGTCMGGLGINDEKAADADLYRKYLEDHGVQSPASIECYMRPLNIVHNDWKPNNLTTPIGALREKLADLAGLPSPQNWPDLLQSVLGMDLPWGKISYWKKYCEYCDWRKNKNL